MADSELWVVPSDWAPLSSIHGDQRVRRLERTVASLADSYNGELHFAENVGLAASVRNQTFKGSGMIIGRVIYTHPGSYWYRVQLDTGGGDIPCCTLSQTPFKPMGVKSLAQIPAHSRVVVHLHGGLPYGIILGCMPHIKDGPEGYSDWISQGSCVGSTRENYYDSLVTRFDKNAGIQSFSHNRPIDSVGVGEQGFFNDLGGGIFIDPMMAFMRMDEGVGLWMFYMDRLAKLAAYNYDFISSVSEQNIRNDDGEGLHFSGYTPYPWEALGMFSTEHLGYDDTTTDEEVHRKSLNAKIEAQFRDQKPIYRLEEYRGYVGQAYMRQVKVPNSNLVSDNLSRYRAPRDAYGVFRESLGLDGSYSIQSAHSIRIGKRFLMPVVSRKKLPRRPCWRRPKSQSTGYKPAGLYGSGKEHKLTDDPRPTGDSPLWGPAGLLDSQAYSNNWKALHPVHYHDKDFYQEGR
jgi:hypothetical protein